MLTDFICVRACKCSDTLLKSKYRYYFLSKPWKLYGPEERFYVLRKEKSGGIRSPKYVVQFGYRI